jgi:ABC-type amino acid transport substrate-binding protein
MRFNDYEEGDVDVVIDDEVIAELEITDKVANRPGPSLKPFKQWLEAPQIGRAPKF